MILLPYSLYKWNMHCMLRLQCHIAPSYGYTAISETNKSFELNMLSKINL